MASMKWWCSCVASKFSQEEVDQRKRSKNIDKILSKEKSVIRRQVKLLLLGAGDSGKSTFLKQMKIIHGDLDADCLSQSKTVIYQNVLRGMKVLVDAREKLNIPWGKSESCAHSDCLLSYREGSTLTDVIFRNYGPSIRELWKDEAIKTAYVRRKEFQLADNVHYFFENIDKLLIQNYHPCERDVLHAREATKTIIEYQVLINKIPFHFIDVGGQRSQRQKWVKCFEGITSILFMVSSSEFDQVLLEDRTTNRMLESLNIFDTIANNRCFSDVSIILFMNKTDILQDKLQKSEADVTKYFPEYKGALRDVEGIQLFFVSMFDNIRRDKKKPFYYHFTTAVDTENIRVVFSAVKDTVLQKNISHLMLQ